MKTEDCTKENIEIYQPESSEKLIGRREVLNKAGMYALSAATMMVLLKSQPAMAQSGGPKPNVYIAPSSGSSTETWQRTKRS